MSSFNSQLSFELENHVKHHLRVNSLVETLKNFQEKNNCGNFLETSIKTLNSFSDVNMCTEDLNYSSLSVKIKKTKW